LGFAVFVGVFAAAFVADLVDVFAMGHCFGLNHKKVKWLCRSCQAPESLIFRNRVNRRSLFGRIGLFFPIDDNFGSGLHLLCTLQNPGFVMIVERRL
jgi:hypothetical protein